MRYEHIAEAEGVVGSVSKACLRYCFYIRELMRWMQSNYIIFFFCLLQVKLCVTISTDVDMLLKVCTIFEVLTMLHVPAAAICCH